MKLPNNLSLTRLLNVSVITPEGIIFNSQSPFVSLQTPDGRIGILPQHENFVSAIASGEIKIEGADGKISYFSIDFGFLEISHNQVDIVVSSAKDAAKMDEALILEAQQNAEIAVREARDKKSKLSAQAILRSNLTDLKVLRKFKKTLN